MAQLLSRLRRAPERLLHRFRRRRVVERLRSRSRPAVVLVVCHGNICRSPFAAAVLSRGLAGTGVRVGSAGFIGPGRPPPPEAVVAAAHRGVDLSAHRSRLLTAELVRAADLIVVMDPAQQREVCDRFGCVPRGVIVLGDLDFETIGERAIRDPVDQGLEVFEASYARIERCAGELARTLARAPSARAA